MWSMSSNFLLKYLREWTQNILKWTNNRLYPSPVLTASKPLKTHLKYSFAGVSWLVRASVWVFMFLQATGGRITMTTDSSEGWRPVRQTSIPRAVCVCDPWATGPPWSPNNLKILRSLAELRPDLMMSSHI